MNRRLVRKQHDLDLNAPGAIEELLAFHRALVGDLRMEDDGDEDGDDGTDDGDDGTDGGDGDDGADGDDKPLGPKGEKALQAEKEKRRTAQAELRKFRDLGLTPEQIKALADKKAGDGDGGDADQLQRDADRKAADRANQRILRSEIKAAAAGKLADPADAYKFLDLADFEVDDDGNVDEDEIADAIDALIKTKPYLAAQGGKRFQGGGDGGARNERGKSQLTKADLEGMTPDEINKARQDGRLTGLGINPKKQ